jgi:hypothetical protein
MKMKKYRRKFILLFSLALSLVCFSNINKAYALRVSPGAFCAQNVEVGQDTDTGIDLVIDNETDQEREFSIKVVPARISTTDSLKGYSALPELGWLRLERTQLIAPAKGQAKARLYISIPNEEKYFNQHWVVSCLIEYVGQKGLFQEAILTRYMIETRPKKEVTERPHGDLAVTPSVVKITESSMEAKQKFSFKLYNNTTSAHTYTIKSFVPKVEPEKLSVNATLGLTWVKKASWVNPGVKRIKLAPGAVGEINLGVRVPKSELTGDKGVEALIFVDSDTGERRFVRIQVE